MSDCRRTPLAAVALGGSAPPQAPEETASELVAKKREIFLVQMGLDTKEQEIQKLKVAHPSWCVCLGGVGGGGVHGIGRGGKEKPAANYPLGTLGIRMEVEEAYPSGDVRWVGDAARRLCTHWL